MVRAGAGNRVLFLAYMFPPLGGSGVQRSVKFVKYLPLFGWTPTVLTVKPISYYVYDPLLLEEVPDHVEIVRTGSLDPLRLSAIVLRDARMARAGNGVTHHPVYRTKSRLVEAYRRIRDVLAVPDVQVGWLPFVIARGLAIVRAVRPQVIYSPGAPYSSAVAAHVLSRLTGVPYVIDFRDPWVDYMFQRFPTPLHRWAHLRLEAMVVRGSAGVVVYGEWLGKRLAARYPEASERITEITNGFDPGDLEGIVPEPRTPGKWRLVYMGSMYERYALNLRTLLCAMQRLPQSVRERLEVVFVGQCYDGLAADIEAAGMTGQIRILGYQRHDVALSWLGSADASLVFLIPGDLAAVTGKVFELLMVGKPIVAVVEPDGECARILRKAGADRWVSHPTDVDLLTRNLAQLAADEFAWDGGGAPEAFSRVRQTETLAAVLESAVNTSEVACGNSGGSTK